jgi:hypothetical protein
MSGDLFNVPNIGTSLGSSIAGAIVRGQMGNIIGLRRRAWLFLSNLSTMMFFAAAAIQFCTAVRVSGGCVLGL